MASNDPTDTGGLFVGRRPGTAPLKYRAQPVTAGERRRTADKLLSGLILTVETLLFLTLSVARRLDYAWKLTRRAAGYEQKKGALETIFVISLAIAGTAFLIWFFIFNGPGSSVFSGQTQ